MIIILIIITIIIIIIIKRISKAPHVAGAQSHSQ